MSAELEILSEICVGVNVEGINGRKLLKVVANEDTNVSPFARAQHLLHTEILCPRHKHVPDFFQKHILSATNVSRFAQHGNHHAQQYVRNNL